jgi:hypothetical protein
MKSTILALAAASLPAAGPISAWAQDASAQAVPFCSDLERVVELALPWAAGDGGKSLLRHRKHCTKDILRCPGFR